MMLTVHMVIGTACGHCNGLAVVGPMAGSCGKLGPATTSNCSPDEALSAWSLLGGLEACLARGVLTEANQASVVFVPLESANGSTVWMAMVVVE